MSLSTEGPDLTSDSQAEADRTQEESLFTTTAPEPLLRRVSSSSSSAASHSQRNHSNTNPSSESYASRDAPDESSLHYQEDYTFDESTMEQEDQEEPQDQLQQQQQQQQQASGRSHALDNSMASSAATGQTAGGGYSSSQQDGSTARQTLTLREQEKMIDSKTKENWNLKLKIFWLEKRLQEGTPENIDAALKDNLDLKLSLQQAQSELKKHKKMCLDLNRVVEDLNARQAQHSADADSSSKALEAEASRLRKENQAQITMLGAHHNEKERLYETIDDLRAQLQDQHQNPKAISDLEDSYARRLDDAEARANHLRDQLAQAQLEDARKEREIEELLNEGDDRDASHADELEYVRAELDRVRQALEDRDEEVAMFVRKIDEFEVLLNNNEAEIGRLRQQIDEHCEELDGKDADIEDLTQENDRLLESVRELGTRVRDLEQTLEDRGDQQERLLSDIEGLEGQVSINQTVIDKLKQKLRATQGSATELESLGQERNFLKDQMEGLVLQHAEDKSQIEDRCRALELELKQHQAKLASARETAHDLEEELQRTRDRLHQTEKDHIGSSSASEAHTQLVDRLYKDLERMEEELERAKRDARRAEEERSFMLNEKKDAESQLASVREQRLRMSDKLEKNTQQLERAQKEVSSLKDKLARNGSSSPSVHRRSMGGAADPTTREQLSERNLLLSNVLSQLERIMPTLHKRDVRPAVDFMAFQELLSSRLRALINLRELWERGLHDVEKKHHGKYESMKREHDSRMKQLERLDKDVKNASDSVKAWKSRSQIKQAEVDTCKTTIADLQAQLASWQSRSREPGTDGPGAGSTSRESAMQARASTAERRLVDARKQIASLESALEDARSKVRKAEGKWEVRLRELEQRLKEEKERVKRERQGGKERAHELEDTISRLQSGVAGQRRRGAEVQAHLDR